MMMTDTSSRAPKRGTLAALALVYAVGGFLLTLALAGGMQLSAQGIAGGVAGGIGSHDTRAPVDIDAGRIVAQEREDRVIFSGDVVVRQADLTVRAQRMQLNYLNATTLELQRLTATGGVTVARGQERASGSTAVYDFNRRIITLVGDVRLKQGANTLLGGRLVIDLDTGVSSVDGQASGGSSGSGDGTGRVSGTFAVPQRGDAGPED
jgi:lipopolysaccharide export system protein LptA